MPVVEIVWWQASEALLADPEIIKPSLEYISKVDGCLGIYSGLAEEDNKTVYGFIVWETLEHHQALINHPEYPAILGLAPSVDGELKLHHVGFTKEFVPALTAPTTEILGITLKEGKTKEDLYKILGSLATKIEAENKHGPVTWGQTVEDPQKFWLTIGWDSVKAHMAIVGEPSILADVTILRSTADLIMFHASLKKQA